MINFRDRSFHPMPARQYDEPYGSNRRRIAIACLYGAACHLAFALAGGAMVVGMYFGLSQGFGQCPAPWGWFANTLLIAQFPIGHSLMLSTRGQRVLRMFAPAPIGSDLSSTIYVALASLQIFALFALWTPSGVIWWQASGWTLGALSALYAGSWLLVGKASYDAGFEVQSGLLGWVSMARGVKPVYPDMPVDGLFAYSRQPIYSSFALTLWTVPTWTPDQLYLAGMLTAYCVVGPRFKERRFERLFGERFVTYKSATPYWLPRRRTKKP